MLSKDFSMRAMKEYAARHDADAQVAAQKQAEEAATRRMALINGLSARYGWSIGRDYAGDFKIAGGENLDVEMEFAVDGGHLVLMGPVCRCGWRAIHPEMKDRVELGSALAHPEWTRHGCDGAKAKKDGAGKKRG